MESGDQAATSRTKPGGKKAKKLSQKEQSERFAETARKLEVDEDGSYLERVFDLVVSVKEKKLD